jgi:hypothetical protein
MAVAGARLVVRMRVGVLVRVRPAMRMGVFDGAVAMAVSAKRRVRRGSLLGHGFEAISALARPSASFAARTQKVVGLDTAQMPANQRLRR